MDANLGKSLNQSAPYDALQFCWERHQFWSAIANQQKKAVIASRRLALVFGVAGAITETLAAQFLAWPQVARIFSLAGAVILAITPFLAKGFGREQILKWIRARSASEGLKTQVFLRMANAGNYAAAGADQTLQEYVAKIDASAKDLAAEGRDTRQQFKPLPKVARPRDYLDQRVRQQIFDFYEKKIRELESDLRACNRAALILTVIAAVIGATAGIVRHESWGVWSAVFTTIAGAVAAYMAAGRYEHLIISYQYTVNQLNAFRANFEPKVAAETVTQADFAAFVLECENIISIENQGWMAAWDKSPQGTPPPPDANVATSPAMAATPARSP